MAATEEVRSLLQDIVAPDLKSLKERVTALEKRVDRGFAEVERRAELRHTELMNYLSLDARIRRLEGARQTEHQ
jgi:hypothetical protein